MKQKRILVSPIPQAAKHTTKEQLRLARLLMPYQLAQHTIYCGLHPLLSITRVRARWDHDAITVHHYAISGDHACSEMPPLQCVPLVKQQPHGSVRRHLTGRASGTPGRFSMHESARNSRRVAEDEASPPSRGRTRSRPLSHAGRLPLRKPSLSSWATSRSGPCAI